MGKEKKFIWMPAGISGIPGLSENEKRLLAYIHMNSTGGNPIIFANDNNQILSALSEETDMTTLEASKALGSLIKKCLVKDGEHTDFRSFESTIEFDETRIPRNYYALEELGVGIGFFAFGLYLYMLSLHPINEEGWFTIDVDELAANFGDKNTRIHKAINKLISCGMLVRKPYRIDGKFFGQMYRVTY